MITAIFLFSISFFQAGAQNCDDCTPDTLKLVRGLTQQGILCPSQIPKASPRALRCRGNIRSYSRPVNFFIPTQLRLSQPISLVYYFHGFLFSAGESAFTGKNGDFGKYLADAGVNAILVAPESLGKNTTYNTELNTPEKAQRFFNFTDAILTTAGLPVASQSTLRLLSGHSGAYVILSRLGAWAASAAVPTLNSLKGIALLDSVYGFREGLVQVIQALCRDSRPYYLLAFNPADGSTSKRNANLQLYRRLTSPPLCPQARIRLVQDRSSGHYDFPRNYLTHFLREALL